MKNYSKDRFAFIDTETGGINPNKHTLLSIGVVIWDCSQGILAEKEFYIKSKRYVVTKEAQKINKFDRVEHNHLAQDPKCVIEELLSFLYQFFPADTYIPIAGHNVQFDVNFLKVFLKKNNRSFNQYFSHRVIDTYSVYKTLVLSGLISENLNSSADAFSYFDIKVSQRHNALGDCIATVTLYEKMIDLIKSNSGDNTFVQ